MAQRVAFVIALQSAEIAVLLFAAEGAILQKKFVESKNATASFTGVVT